VSNHKSYDEGYERGLKVGLHKGYNKGWSEGYNKGLYEDSHKSVKPSHDEALLKALKEWHESS
jgi:flagellar biosynthesis/type III secretory pathway protein FliH